MRLWVLSVTCLIAFCILEAFLVLLIAYSPYPRDATDWTIVVVVPILLFGGIPLLAYWGEKRRAEKQDVNHHADPREPEA